MYRSQTSQPVPPSSLPVPSICQSQSSLERSAKRGTPERWQNTPMISTRPSAGWMLARWAQGASPASQSRACWWAASTAPEGLFLLLLLCPSPLQPEKHPRALLPEDARCQSLSSSPSRKERELFRLALCTWPGWSPPPLPWGRRRVMLLAGTVSLTPWG